MTPELIREQLNFALPDNIYDQIAEQTILPSLKIWEADDPLYEMLYDKNAMILNKIRKDLY